MYYIISRIFLELPSQLKAIEDSSTNYDVPNTDERFETGLVQYLDTMAAGNAFGSGQTINIPEQNNPMMNNINQNNDSILSQSWGGNPFMGSEQQQNVLNNPTVSYRAESFTSLITYEKRIYGTIYLITYLPFSDIYVEKNAFNNQFHGTWFYYKYWFKSKSFWSYGCLGFGSSFKCKQQ